MSACLSTCVALLALWLWGQSQGRGADAMGVLTVTYESMDSDRGHLAPHGPLATRPGRLRQKRAIIRAGSARDAVDARPASSFIVITEPQALA